MRIPRVSVLIILMVALLAVSTLAAAQAPDRKAATGKLGVFLGQWESNAMFMGSKVSSKLECRWSPGGNFLVCEQVVTTAQGQQTQLTIYAWNSREGAYTFSTFSNPGEPPSTGHVAIKGNVWTYSFSFEENKKKILMRTTNEFTAPGVETFKSERSEDDGAHWTVFLEGKGRRVGK
jgi:hypothetical protein